MVLFDASASVPMEPGGMKRSERIGNKGKRRYGIF